MEIKSRALLNQAENILKDRKGDNKATFSSEGRLKNDSSVNSDSIFTRGAMESRMLSLQENLTRLQSQYSREQARLGYLEKEQNSVNGSIEYDGESLFPELAENPDLDRSSLLELVKRRMEGLTHSLKGGQVEMENMLALSFRDPSEFTVNAADLSNLSASLNPIQPGRVAQLTRNS